MLDERELLINPVVQENVVHNTKTVTDVRSLTASVFGVAAGVIGLESYTGFAFYLVGSFFVSFLMVMLLAQGKPSSYFTSATEMWTMEVFGGSSLAAFVLTWTLFYNLVRA
ncbi:Rab5-interacting protein-domain-containing protein [Geopyxis carbonaria]|nr:Rab5-interacting protein-domain-containing protein [Geopyxis carbonaria]